MKLSDWARKTGISYITAYRWFNSGKIDGAYKVGRTIMVDESSEDDLKKKTNGKTYIYCRVSSSMNKQNLDTQAERCAQFCTANGFAVEKTYKEVASGMNDKRRKLMKLLELNPERIVVEHKDRLTRFGFNYLEVLLNKLGTELVVINRDEEDESDLIKDFVSIITSFCCRLYGLRRGQRKSSEVKKLLEDENS